MALSHRILVPRTLVQQLRFWTLLPNLVQGVPLQAPNYQIVITTDACNLGWGGHLRHFQVQGRWDKSQAKLHINCKELLAVHLTLKTFLHVVQNKVVKVRTDNIPVKEYINHLGGTGSHSLCALTINLLNWCHQKGIHLMAEHVPGVQNVLADSLSRKMLSQTEWSLKKTVVQTLFKFWETPLIDLFATQENKQTLMFCSWRFHNQALHIDALTMPLAGPSGLCLSTSQHSSESHLEGQSGGSNVDSDSPELAEQTLVSSDFTGIDRGPHSVASIARPVDTAQGKTMASEPGSLVPGSMENKLRALIEEGLSEQVAQTIIAARSQSTYKAYEAGWTHFSRWCAGRDDPLDPFVTDVTQILAYLDNCLKVEKLSHSTIRNRIHAIALYHRLFPLTALSRHVWVKNFLKGAHRLCPRAKDIHPVWDLQLVLQSLRDVPFEPMVSGRLRWLTLKTIFIIAITSAKRVGEIQALSMNPKYLNISPAGVRLRLNPSFIPKVNSEENRESEILLPPFCPNENPHSRNTLRFLCPVRAVSKYLEATKAFRQTDALFVCFGEGPKKGCKASKATISRWVRICIQEAYQAKGQVPPEGIKAHQTRGQAASWAQFNGASITDICKSATWTSACTFARFYQLNLADNVSSARFATNVLQTVLDGRPH